MDCFKKFALKFSKQDPSQQPQSITYLIGSLAETFNGHGSLKPDIILPVWTVWFQFFMATGVSRQSNNLVLHTSWHFEL